MKSFYKKKELSGKSFNEKNRSSQSPHVKLALIALLIGSMSYSGIFNLKEQYSIQGEYNDYTMEKMMNWINENTQIDDAIVGSMSTMANVKLSTNRPIVNHPHYENVDLRAKTKKIYSHLYGFRPYEELNSILKNNFSAKYLIMENYFCYSHPPGKPECAMSEIAHLDSFKKKTNKKACELILSQDAKVVQYFKKRFSLNYLYIFEIV